MRFFAYTLALVASSSPLAIAQSNGAAGTANNANSFNVPTNGYLLSAGQPTTFTWSNKQGSTVTLTLRDGSNGALNAGQVIQANVPNTGSYTWNVPGDIVEGASYTVQITDDQDSTVTNYTPQFVIQSPHKAAQTYSPSGSSGSASATAMPSGSTTVMTLTTTNASGTTTMTTTSVSTTAMPSGSSSSGKPSGSSSSGSSTGTSSSGTSSARSTVPTNNVAPLAQAPLAGGLLAAVAGVMVAL